MFQEFPVDYLWFALFYLKPVVVAAYELLIELDDGFDKRDGMNQLRPCLCWFAGVFMSCLDIH